jgi:hypothetical protein
MRMFSKTAAILLYCVPRAIEIHTNRFFEAFISGSGSIIKRHRAISNNPGTWHIDQGDIKFIDDPVWKGAFHAPRRIPS